MIITGSQKIPDQQNLAGRSIGLLIICAPTNRLRDLMPLIPPALATLDAMLPGQVVRIS